ncbi:MAG: biopolymer transporter ExbD [Alphaproteobacteria bacterium]
MEFEGRRRIRMGLNLVPLINVIFLLLIFFMLAGTLSTPDPFPVVRPESTTGDSSQVEPLYEPVEIVVAPDGRIAFNGGLIPRDELPGALAGVFKGGATPAVTFTIDARANTGDMVDLINMMRAAGARLVLLSTHPPKSD